VAVEMRKPLGPRILYGLLGATFREEDSGNLLASISVTHSNGMPFGDSLAKGDTAYWGFPREYAEAVLKTVQASESRIGPGRLDFCCAAHAEIGSNQLIFALLTRTLLRALRDHLEGEAIAEITFAQSLAEIAALLSGRH
jgi:hypothetical protein